MFLIWEVNSLGEGSCVSKWPKEAHGMREVKMEARVLFQGRISNGG